MQYILKDKFERPNFFYILVVWHFGHSNYYLYHRDEIELALNQLKTTLGKNAFLGQYENSEKGYKVIRQFELNFDEKIEYVSKKELHFKFYCDSGEWLNPQTSD